MILRGVTVIDVREGRRLPNQAVVIVGHRIQAIGPTDKARIPKAAPVVDARGKYLIPGLWDMHVHPERYADLVFPLYVANGITGVRDAGSEVPLAQLVRWKREIVAGSMVGPRYLVSGPTLNVARATGPRASSVAVSIPDTAGGSAMYVSVPPTLAQYVVDSLQAGGVDFLKMYDLPRAMYLEIAAEARRKGMLFGGHAQDIGGLLASDSGATFLDHGPWAAACEGSSFDAAQCAAVAERLRRNNTWVTMLDGVDEYFPARLADHLRYLPASLPLSYLGEPGPPLTFPTSTADWARVWANRSKGGGIFASLVSSLVAAKMPLLVGSDGALAQNGGMTRAIIPGVAVPEVLMAFVLAGMTPLEALQSATLNPALALRATDSLGTVAAGKLADLVLLDADPLADIWNVTQIRAVVTNGHYYDRAALDVLLAEAARAAARR